MRLAPSIASLVLASVACAQDPVVQFGSASPVGSNQPTRISTIGTPRIGDSSFTLQLDCAQPNSNAFLLLSSNHDSFTVQGLEFLIELGPDAVCLGPIPVDADGVAEYALPIDPNDSLLGTQLVAQWVSQNADSPSGLEATRAVRVTVGQPEFRAVLATRVEVQLRDSSGVLDTASIAPLTEGLASSGSSLAVRADGRVAVVGLSRAMVSSELRWIAVGDSELTEVGTTEVEVNAVQIAFHPVTGNLFTYSGLAGLGPTPFTVREFDGDPDSPTFMSEIDSIAVLGGLGQRMDISPSGDRLIVSSGFSFQVIDTEPGSPTEGQVLLTRELGALRAFAAVSPAGDTFFGLPPFSTDIEETDIETGLLISSTPLSDGLSIAGSLCRTPAGEIAAVRIPSTELAFFEPFACGDAEVVTTLPAANGFGSQSGVSFSLDGSTVFGVAGPDLVEIDRASGVSSSTPTGLVDLVTGIAVR
ncbi:MAG: hypothetical protein AAF196_07350 [Planctomycetota bacterium]